MKEQKGTKNNHVCSFRIITCMYVFGSFSHYHKWKTGILFGDNCPKHAEIRGKRNGKTNIFLVSRQYLVFKCMDLSKIVLQGSLPERKDWDLVWWLFILEGKQNVMGGKKPSVAQYCAYDLRSPTKLTLCQKPI